MHLMIKVQSLVEVGRMNKDHEQLKPLLNKKHNLMKSLEWAVINNDRLLAQVLEKDLKATLKEIKKLKQQ